MIKYSVDQEEIMYACNEKASKFIKSKVIELQEKIHVNIYNFRFYAYLLIIYKKSREKINQDIDLNNTITNFI